MFHHEDYEGPKAASRNQEKRGLTAETRSSLSSESPNQKLLPCAPGAAAVSFRKLAHAAQIITEGIYESVARVKTRPDKSLVLLGPSW